MQFSLSTQPILPGIADIVNLSAGRQEECPIAADTLRRKAISYRNI
jgi:hypothetical protein